MILPHLGIGVGLMLLAMAHLAVMLAGRPIQARVIGTDVTGRSKGTPTYYVRFEYADGGMPALDRQKVNARQFAAIHSGAILHGRMLKLGGRRLALTDAGNAWGVVAQSFAFALFWNGITSTFLWFLWITPLRRKSLVRHGIAAAGRVVCKRRVAGKSTQYYVSYLFDTPALGLIIGEMSVARKRYDAVEKDDPVTVLYDPGSPSRSIAYDLSDFEVVPARG